MTASLPRVDILGTGISVSGAAEVSRLILSPPQEGLVVAVSNVHTVMSARRSAELAQLLRRADVVTADGMPLVWAQRALGATGAERVDGLRLFTTTMEAGLPMGSRHFLYGSSPEILQMMQSNLRRSYPDLQMAGVISPPFRPLSPEEEAADVEAIRASRPDVVWVGLGMPKQELWMDRVHHDLPGVALVGVGAVFQWVAGTVRKAPRWMQRAGLEWLFRMAQEPRLWRRYVWNNPAFVVLCLGQVLRRRLGK